MNRTVEIEMQVDHHPSGRYTLKERPVGSNTWTDLKETPFLTTDNALAFYRAVASRLASYSFEGIRVASYRDTAP